MDTRVGSVTDAMVAICDGESESGGRYLGRIGIGSVGRTDGGRKRPTGETCHV
jgi:hypothetical protein